jgi:putative PIN family toxin of toxin-antitoxin system
MRVVLDTNIIVSATIARHGHADQILRKWHQGKIELIVSPLILDEIEDVLTRPRIVRQQWMTREEVKDLILRLQTAAIMVLDRLDLKVVTDDPDDDKFFAAALEGGAEYIVSGDPHLLEIKEYQSIKILAPAKFLKLL